MPEKTASARGRMDQQLAQAVDFARENAVEVGGEASVGEHLSFEMNAERLGTHYFACNDAGYVGWRWSVTLTRVRARGRSRCVKLIWYPVPARFWHPSGCRGRTAC